MTIHVFADSLGLYPSYVVQNVDKYNTTGLVRFVNLVDQVKIQTDRIELITGSISSQQQYVSRLTVEVTRVVFHAYQPMSYYFLSFIRRKYPAAKMCWVFWSFEIYNRPSVYLDILGKFSKQYYLSKGRSRLVKIKQWLYRILPDVLINAGFRIMNKALVTERKFIQSFAAIHEFYSLLDNDYVYLRTHFDVSHMKHEKFAYLSLEKMIPDLENEMSPGNLIMVGHSAAIEGNQYEILTMLSPLSVSVKRRIWLPLAYGNEDYRKVIRLYAKSIFSQVEILEDKLTPADYYQKLKQVGYCILNIKVQQGIGNITALLWYGVKLFLSKESGMYIDFKQSGFMIYSIEDDLNEEELNLKLTEDQIQTNRRILKSLLSDQKLSVYWRKLN